MNEADRRARNTAKLTECYPAFGSRLARAIVALERQGFRPRIQEAYRSPADQQAAYERGTSKLRYGLHNATSPAGAPESLAADVLDDDAPAAPGTRYLLALAVAAADAGLETGILWGLSGADRTATAAAVRTRDLAAKVRVGWDPTHVQVPGLTASAVQQGARPAADTTTTQPTSTEEEDMPLTDVDVKKIVDSVIVRLGQDANHNFTIAYLRDRVRDLGEQIAAGGQAIDYDLLADKLADRLATRLSQ